MNLYSTHPDFFYITILVVNPEAFITERVGNRLFYNLFFSIKDMTEGDNTSSHSTTRLMNSAAANSPTQHRRSTSFSPILIFNPIVSPPLPQREQQSTIKISWSQSNNRTCGGPRPSGNITNSAVTSLPFRCARILSIIAGSSMQAIFSLVKPQPAFCCSPYLRQAYRIRLPFLQPFLCNYSAFSV